MKLIVYTGKCASKTVNGVKFTQSVRTANVSDEVGSKFKGLEEFQIIDIQKEAIVPPKEDAKLKKLLKLTEEQLQEMCLAKGLEIEGTKEELADRLLNGQE